jgi:signal transduction histidine kinase
VAQDLANAPEPATGGRAEVVEFIAPAHLPTTGDRRLLLTVLQDLLGNAWKFTSRTTRPRVELGVQACPLGVGPEGVGPAGVGTAGVGTAGVGTAGVGTVGTEYFVRDNGVGFQSDSTEKLFTLFQRLHSRSDFPGTGIGLASVKRIIDKHGGTVRATGSPDAGATFFFTLPEPTTTRASHLPRPRADPGSQPMRRP